MQSGTKADVAEKEMVGMDTANILHEQGIERKRYPFSIESLLEKSNKAKDQSESEENTAALNTEISNSRTCTEQLYENVT